MTLPLPPEPEIDAWQRYADDAGADGVFAALARRLPQLRFPIQEGISQREPYRAATRRGISPDGILEASGLALRAPGRLRLVIHPSPGGPVPVLVTGDRQDFATLVRALSMRNEPLPVPGSMGACLVKGFNNWDRVWTYRRDWEAQDPANLMDGARSFEFQRLLPRRELYQDTFFILSAGPYSGVAAELGLPEEEWARLSLAIRMEHECIHYATLRLLGASRNNALDELIADYLGIVAATGHFRADWLLRFLGLEAFPACREGGRLQNYRGRPPISGESFCVLRSLVHAAARNLERFHAEQFPDPPDAVERGRVLLALTRLTLEELASPTAPALLARLLKRQEGHILRPLSKDP